MRKVVSHKWHKSNLDLKLGQDPLYDFLKEVGDTHKL